MIRRWQDSARRARGYRAPVQGRRAPVHKPMRLEWLRRARALGRTLRVALHQRLSIGIGLQMRLVPSPTRAPELGGAQAAATVMPVRHDPALRPAPRALAAPQHAVMTPV